MTDEWTAAHAAIKQQIEESPRFPELVRCYGGIPSSHVPSTRASRLAAKICVELGLDPKVWKGNVYGAAVDRINAR